MIRKSMEIATPVCELARNDREVDKFQFTVPQNDTERVRLGAITDHARHDLAARPAGKFQFSLPAEFHPLPALGKLTLAKPWKSAYNETVYAAFFWSCLETMVKANGVCVVESQALVEACGDAIAYRRMG